MKYIQPEVLTEYFEVHLTSMSTGEKFSIPNFKIVECEDVLGVCHVVCTFRYDTHMVYSVKESANEVAKLARLELLGNIE